MPKRLLRQAFNLQPICSVAAMGISGLDDIDTWSDNMSAAPQSVNEASPYPWPAISCVSSPYANRVGTIQALGAAVQRSSAQPVRGSAVLKSPAAQEHQRAMPPGQPSVPLGCILIDPGSVSPALAHDRHTGAPALPVPDAEKENTPSPEKIKLISHTAPALAPAEVQAMREARADIDSRGIAHRQAPLQQALQQASPLALGAPAHHSLHLPASTKQDQHLTPRPASAQVSLCIYLTCSLDTLWLCSLHTKTKGQSLVYSMQAF